MAPMITLYILGGCVAAAAVLFIVMIVLTALRPPQLPDVSTRDALDRVLAAFTPPFATAIAGPKLIAPPANIPPPPRAQAAFARMASEPAPPRSPLASSSQAPISPTAFLQRGPFRIAPAQPSPPPAPPAAPRPRATYTTDPDPAPVAAPVAAPIAAPRLAAPSVAPPVNAPTPVTIQPTTAPRPNTPTRLPVQRKSASSIAPSSMVAPPRARSPQLYKPVITPIGPPRHRQTQKVRTGQQARTVSRPVYPARRGRTIFCIVIGFFIAGALATTAAVAVPAMLDPLCEREWFGSGAAETVREHASNTNGAIAEFIHDEGVFEPIGIWSATN